MLCEFNRKKNTNTVITSRISPGGEKGGGMGRAPTPSFEKSLKNFRERSRLIFTQLLLSNLSCLSPTTWISAVDFDKVNFNLQSAVSRDAE